VRGRGISHKISPNYYAKIAQLDKDNKTNFIGGMAVRGEKAEVWWIFIIYLRPFS
jgi:hypothetical protein